MSCGPPGWRNVGDFLNVPVGESGQDVVQVIADGDPEPAAAFNHGEDRGHTRSGLLAADVDPVFSTQSNSPDILPMSVKN